MQDRYAGDIGDFAKFALLRKLLGGTELQLGLVWYLTRQHGDPKGDGRHTDYLTPSVRNEQLYRACDGDLYDRLAEIKRSGVRSVGVFPSSGVLPSGTIFCDSLLTFDDLPKGGTLRLREQRRQTWADAAVKRTASCDVVMFDPDNGLEVRTAGRYSARGPKYVFFDELAPYVTRGQTMIVYQHAARFATMPDQVAQRLSELQRRLPLDTEPFALVWRPISTRAFFVVPAREHAELLASRAASLLSGPLGRHVYRIPRSLNL